MKKLVIRDIARLAGVSSSTVSKAINDYDDIPKETKKKIKEIISENNYQPSKFARILRKGKNESIAFVSGRIASHFTVEILGAIERSTFATHKYVHGIIPYSTNYDNRITADIFNKLLYGNEVSAVIALAMNPDEKTLLKYEEAGMPLILLENKMANAHSVNTDNFEAGFMAAEYLLKKGRKNIGLICGGVRSGSREGYSYAAENRKAGFEEALKKYGLSMDKDMVRFAAHYTIEEGMDIFEKFMLKRAGLDAVFCASGDMTAIGVMETAKRHGLRIPEDLAVIGFDDSAAAAYVTPPLTTIKQNIDEIGTEALYTADRAIEGKLKSFRHVIVKPELVIRKSA